MQESAYLTGASTAVGTASDITLQRSLLGRVQIIDKNNLNKEKGDYAWKLSLKQKSPPKKSVEILLKHTFLLLPDWEEEGRGNHK